MGGSPQKPAPGHHLQPLYQGAMRQPQFRLRVQMPSHPDMIEALLRSQLLADMSTEQRRDLSLRFEVRPFSSGQTLIAHGSGGRALLEILAGTADVFVKEEEHRYRRGPVRRAMTCRESKGDV